VLSTNPYYRLPPEAISFPSACRAPQLRRLKLKALLNFGSEELKNRARKMFIIYIYAAAINMIIIRPHI
jgi:hypothetical protein